MPAKAKKKASGASGPNVEEWQRGTVRVRIDRKVHILARSLALAWGCEPVDAIERAVIEAAEAVSPQGGEDR